MTEHDELLALLDAMPSNLAKKAATAIRWLQAQFAAERDKRRLIEAQDSRLCDQVYEEDGETLKIVAERKAREEVWISHDIQKARAGRAESCLRDEVEAATIERCAH